MLPDVTSSLSHVLCPWHMLESMQALTDESPSRSNVEGLAETEEFLHPASIGDRGTALLSHVTLNG